MLQVKYGIKYKDFLSQHFFSIKKRFTKNDNFTSIDQFVFLIHMQKIRHHWIAQLVYAGNSFLHQDRDIF